MLRDIADNRGDLSQVKNLYAMGSGIVNFLSAYQGNQFDNLELPDTIYSLNLNNTSWNNFSFWHTTANGSSATFTRYKVGNNSSLWVPTGIQEMVLNGTTGHTLNSKNLVMTWINGIIASLGANPTDEEINAALATRTLRMNDVRWDEAACGEYLLTYDEIALIAKIGTLELKGYIMLAGDENHKLTSDQLTQLTQWFGNDIFTYSSSGLIVDYALDSTIISVSGDVTLDEHNEIHLKEGHTAILNATKFHLSNNVQSVQWAIRERILDGNDQPIDTIPGDVVRNATFLDTSNPRQVTLRAANSTYDGYDVDVICQIEGDESATMITVHIDPTDYPVLAIEPTNGNARVSGNEYTLYSGGIADNFAVVVKSAAAGAIGIQGVSWSIRLANGTTVPVDLVNDPTTYKMINNSTILSYKRGTSRMDIMLSAGITVSDETIYEYTLVADVNLVGKIETLTCKVIVMNDASPIITGVSGGDLFTALNTLYASIHGSGVSAFYRSTLMSLTGTLDLSPYPNLSRLVVSTNKSIFYYLTSLTGLVMDGCTALHNTYNNGGTSINQMDFSKMGALQNLSLQGCTGLTSTLSLINNTDIRQVDASGTTVNFILPNNPKLTKFELGTPASILIENPTVLATSGVKVDNCANLDYLELHNIPIANNGSDGGFHMFDKIMKMSIIGGTIATGVKLISQPSAGQLYYEQVDNNNYAITSKIEIPAGHTINVKTQYYCDAVQLNASSGYVDFNHIDPNSYPNGRNLSFSGAVKYIVIGNVFSNDGNGIGSILVTDTTANEVLFNYSA